MSINNIKINEEWFYHRTNSVKLNKILKSGGLKARKHLSKSDKREAKNGTWNGNHFISLAKKNTEHRHSAYKHYITGEFAFIIEDVDAIKTEKKDLGSIFETLSKLPINKRYSYWEDEYQVKDFIPMDNIVGIKLPHKKRFFHMLYSDDHNIKELDRMLKILEEQGYDLPFIDIEEEKVISNDEVKKYLLKKEQKTRNK